MRLIALDTATGAPTLCLRRDGIVAGYWRGALRSGPQAVVEAAQALVADAGMSFDSLDAVAFGRGPGAFTGVRLAVALAQGLALGAGLPVAPVSDLAALAWHAGRRHGWRQVIACLDARQSEIYWGAFRLDGHGLPRAAGPEQLSAPAELAEPDGEWALAGSGTAVTEWTGARDSSIAPDAQAVAALAAPMVCRGELLPAEQAAPCYLREHVAIPSSKRHNRFLT